MCASVSYDAPVVIDDGPRIRCLNGEPPGKIVQTNLNDQGVSKTQTARTRHKNPVPQLKTQPTTMGNQQGSEGGKNQQGSKKKEKKDNSKSNSPDGGGSLRKGKSPSVKSKSSPASPGKKLFRRKQQTLEKEKPKEEEPKAQGACVSNQQSVTEVFTDARETVEENGQKSLDKCEKPVCDSSSDNISFESVSCATPLRVATPCTQRAKPPATVNPVDRVDELGKSIERTIMERFSDNSSKLLEVKPGPREPVADITLAKPSEPAKTETQTTKLPSELLESDKQAETKDKVHQASCERVSQSDSSISNPQNSVDEGLEKAAKPIKTIKIEQECIASSSECKASEEAVINQKGTSSKVDDNPLSDCPAPNEIVTSASPEISLEFSKAAVDVSEPFAEGENSSVNINESVMVVENLVGSELGTGESAAAIHKKVDKPVQSETEVNVDYERNTTVHLETDSRLLTETSMAAKPATNTTAHCETDTIKHSEAGTMTHPEANTAANPETGSTAKTEAVKTVQSEIDAALPSEAGTTAYLKTGTATHDEADTTTHSEAVSETDPNVINEVQVTETKDHAAQSANTDEILKSACKNVETVSRDNNITQDTNSGSKTENEVQAIESVLQPVGDPIMGTSESVLHASPKPNAEFCDTVNTTEKSSTGIETVDKESSESSPTVNTPTECHPPLTRLFISESDILKPSETNTEECTKENTKNVIKEEIKFQPACVSPRREKRGDLLSQQSASVDKTFLEPANRQATLAEKRQHRLTDPLVDTLLLLIKQTMESDNECKQGEVIHASTTEDEVSSVKRPEESTEEKDNQNITDEAFDIDKTLTPEDMAEFERLKGHNSPEEETSIGGMDDDTLTQEGLAEFDRLKKQMSKGPVDTDNLTEHEEDFTLQSEDRFDLSSGETTEDSVIERPFKKVPALAATLEEDFSETHANVITPGPKEAPVAHAGRWPDVTDFPEIRSMGKPESPVLKKRSLTEDEIRREIRRFMIPEMKEALPDGSSMKQMLNDLHDITPTSELYPSMEDRESSNSPEQDNSSGPRSRTSITSSELDISEQRDDMSTDSMYADDEDDSSSEVLFCKTYTEPVRGTEVLVSCTVVNSALKEANSSSDEFWAENSAAEDAYQQVEFAAAAVNRHFTHARSQMQDIQHHLQALKYQMQDMEKEVVKPTQLPSTDEFAFDDPERRAITD